MLFLSPLKFFGPKEASKTFMVLFSNTYYQDVEKFKVGNPRTFHYLNQSNCFELDVLDDSKEYLETKRAMDIVGINQAEQVMHLDCYFSWDI